MTFREGLLAARGHIAFLLALVAAFALIISLERLDQGPGGGPGAATAPRIAESADRPAPRAPRASTEADRAAAVAAWRYFELNTRPETGLADSLAGFPAATMWDTGSYLLGAIAAERLGVLARPEFDARMARALATLAALPLVEGALPNKSYDTRTGAMTDYQNRPVPEGIGWSALDIARVLTPLNILLRTEPEHAPAVQRILARWDLGAMVEDGELIGLAPGPDGYARVQEGRVGYEQYAAKSVALMGHDVTGALDLAGHLDFAEVEGVEVPVDARDPRIFEAHTHTLSEPYILDGLEFGWDARSRELAWRVFLAQQRRFEATGTLTAVTEDHLDQAPHFVYGAVIANGEPWAVLTDAGEPAEAFRTLSAKAAIGWDALYATPYAARLRAAAAPLADAEAGWRAGIYEADGRTNAALTANTNGVILEAMHYLAFGPMLHPVRGAATAAAAR